MQSLFFMLFDFVMQLLLLFYTYNDNQEMGLSEDQQEEEMSHFIIYQDK